MLDKQTAIDRLTKAVAKQNPDKPLAVAAGLIQAALGLDTPNNDQPGNHAESNEPDDDRSA